MNKEQFIRKVQIKADKEGFTFDRDSINIRVAYMSLEIDVYSLTKNRFNQIWSIGECYTLKKAKELKKSLEKNMILKNEFIEIEKDYKYIYSYDFEV